MATKKTKISPMQDIENLDEQEAAASTIAQLNESTVQAAESGDIPKSGETIRSTFFIDSGYWNYFKIYAEAKGASASSLLVEFIEKTIRENKDRIDRYVEGKAVLRKHFDD